MDCCRCPGIALFSTRLTPSETPPPRPSRYGMNYTTPSFLPSFLPSSLLPSNFASPAFDSLLLPTSILISFLPLFLSSSPMSCNHQAAASLTASFRWCLTGTPLQNKPDDIQSLFHFLRVHPVQDKSVFQQVVSKPIQLGEETGLTRLRLLLSTVSLRRAKAIIAGSVPPKTCVDSRVRLTGRAEDVYSVLFQSARLVVKTLLQVRIYTNILTAYY